MHQHGRAVVEDISAMLFSAPADHWRVRDRASDLKLLSTLATWLVTCHAEKRNPFDDIALYGHQRKAATVQYEEIE